MGQQEYMVALRETRSREVFQKNVTDILRRNTATTAMHDWCKCATA